MPEKIAERVERAIRERVFPGCVIGLIRTNKRIVLPFGTLDYGQELVKENTIYDVASVTKSIPVASLALTFIEEGKLSLADKVTKYVPELQNDYGATIEDLLRYRVHGARLSGLQLRTFEQVRSDIFENGFSAAPGESYYTNLPAYLLGVVIERVAGEILPALAHKYFFEPLKMSDTTFFPHDIVRVAPTEIVDGKEIRGIVHDESARVFSRARRAVGHAGLFSTAPDLLNFLAALLRDQGPSLVHVREGAEQGLGWQVNEPRWMGKFAEKKTFGKTGFTGTCVVCDVERGVAFVVLSNRTYPRRPADGSAIDEFRRDIADIILVK